MSDITDNTTGGSEDAPAHEAVSTQAETPAAAWSPATDAGVPGPSAEEQPKPRRAAPPTRGGDAPLRRKPPAAKPVSVDADQPTPEGDRIAKAVARAGIASRRDVEAMIEQGRVTLNGEVLTSPAVNVTDADVITVDGEPLPTRERTRLWLFHKPRGLVTTARDPEGRQTVFESLPEDLPRVVAVGRLDINTEGLLLLTNDGGLAKVIAHPDTGWLRRYRVRAHGDTTQAELDKLRKGVTIDGMDYGPIEAVLDRASGDNLWLTLGLREGKNREVKRILEHLGLAVNRLIRLSFGPFQLGDIEVGLVEEIRTKVLKEQLGPGLAEQAGVDFESPVREPIAAFGSPKQQSKQPARSASEAQQRRSDDERPRDERPRPARDGYERAPSRGGDRPMRKPAAPARVPTGGNSAGPRRSVWRAEAAAPQEGAPRAVKIPRRGADPKAEREAAASRGRERVGAINTGDRRVLVERLKSTPQEPAAEPHRRDSAFRRDDAAAERPVRTVRQADARAARRDEQAQSQGPRRFDGAAPRGNARPDGAERRGPPRGGDERPRTFKPGPSRDGGGFGERSERPAFNRGEPRGDRPFGNRADKPGGFRGDKPGGFRGDKPAGFRGDKPAGFRGDKPGGFRGGERPGGDRGGFSRPSSDGIGAERAGGGERFGKPGGFKAGGKPGGFGRPGGKPGGFGAKPGGAGKPGGFGGKPGGFGAKPGGKPGFGNRGGAGGKPGGGAGRPPRGGSR